ncbi:hypothetical protein [Mucilaginibacter sp.]|uniref:hypothetical protein n=1 Tax=Mucilaginibacter sp. TaxID=1882438 RepID=UPI00284D7DC2|nr:hypothetical protein [Mucilaginibacter sp.]MDR3696093.1 hypothetical protein [Mucilaginibacter sp.]
MKSKILKAGTFVLALLAAGAYFGCTPEKLDGEGNGLSPKSFNASFTVTPVAGKANYYVLKADPSGVQSIQWDLGDGGGLNAGKMVDTVFYPDAGIYNVSMQALGYIGGVTKTSAAQTITVATSDPKSGNLVVGGKMQAGDDANWTHFIIGGGQQIVFDASKGVMTANESNYNQGAVYQALNLTAGQKYMVDMIVSGSGATNTWFEVWVGATQPVAGSDYNSGSKIISLNTWSGCGGTAFSGKLSAITCSGTGDPFTVPTTGTYYLVIKCGGQNTGLTGISFTNVTLRGVN